jgi:hypothetical protein
VIFSALMQVLQHREEEGEVRHTEFETRATREGSSPRCGHGGGGGSISAEEVARATGGWRGGAQWGCAGWVARTRSEEVL